MAKRIFNKKGRKVNVKTTYVPKKKMSKKIKNWSYRTPSKGGSSHVVQVTTTKVFRNAKAAANYGARAKK